ncbi:MAG TPA: L,D-transpeptidase family protein [Bacteroidia bacterium]|nr:L,D-transpeptidase family protein [Bacteroidia bacterium]
MKIKSILALLFAAFLVSFTSENFKKDQLKYTNVRTAYKEKWSIVKEKLATAGVDTNNFQVFIRVFKQEAKLEVWAKSPGLSQFKLVETYAICQSSGELGPKRKQGDRQVPEGFYEVASFNPQSEFYLALKVSYPNKSDLMKAIKGDPGGDIMIHGNCVTIGCMPLTDDKIKEVYIMAVEARNHGQQNIPIHIFPAQLNDSGMQQLKSLTDDMGKINFWTNLQAGYQYFETKKIPPKIGIDTHGNYTID